MKIWIVEAQGTGYYDQPEVFALALSSEEADALAQTARERLSPTFPKELAYANVEIKEVETGRPLI